MRAPKNKGFSLVEMMVAITIGLGLLAGLTTVLSGTSMSTRTNDRTSDLMTNGRYALNMMKQELRQAGFRGYTWAEPTAAAALGSLANECLEAGAPAGTAPMPRSHVGGPFETPCSPSWTRRSIQGPI